MSHILEEAVQQGDPQRVADLAANDAERQAEARRVRADLEYLARRKQREQQRGQELVELELSYHQRMGWLL
jgi:cell division septum initiation protein DivIVA